MLTQMFFRPAEPLAASYLTFAEKGGNLAILVLEDFAQQEDGSLYGLELLEQYEESQRDRFLYAPGDRADTFFLLKSGSVRLYRLTPSGKRLDLAVIEPGMFFGEMSLLGESRHYT